MFPFNASKVIIKCQTSGLAPCYDNKLEPIKGSKDSQPTLKGSIELLDLEKNTNFSHELNTPKEIAQPDWKKSKAASSAAE